MHRPTDNNENTLTDLTTQSITNDLMIETERVETNVLDRLKGLITRVEDMAINLPSPRTPRSTLSPRGVVVISSPIPVINVTTPLVVPPVIAPFTAVNINAVENSNIDDIHHARNLSGMPPSDIDSHNNEPRGYRLKPTRIVREKPSYFYIAAILSTLTSGGWVITSSFNLKTMITWMAVVMFFYTFQHIKRNLACGTSTNGYSVYTTQEYVGNTITLKMAETIYVEAMPVGVDAVVAQLGYMPFYCDAELVRIDTTLYMRLTNMYRWHKLIVSTDTIYCGFQEK